MHKRPDGWWDKFFLGMAEYISTASKDPSTKVGAVIVDNNRMVVGLGYNGFPRGVADTEERYNDRPTKYKMIVHAEQNAIINAGHRTEGSTIYVYPAFGKPPLCSTCAKSVIQAGIKRVVGYIPQLSSDVIERWSDEIAFSQTMCGEAGLIMDMLEQ